jgi:hypothetical protein
MGHLEDDHKIMLVGRTPPGTCPECAIKHDSEQPHDKNSLVYQYKFYDKHGKWPTWKDAMMHCPDEIKSAWIEELSARGVSLE